MKRRGFGILAAIRRLLGLGPEPEREPEEPVDNPDLIYYPVVGGHIQFDKSTGTITGCKGVITGAIIPEEIEGVPVTAIGSGAFKRSCDSLTVVSLPKSVTTIHNAAFCNCCGLRKINIPDSVTSIGKAAFLGCSGLTDITIPDSITSLCGNIFYDCRRLTGVHIPGSMTSIDEGVFCLCPGLTDVYYDGTREEYETKLLPGVNASNNSFLDAALHCREDDAPSGAGC